MLAGPKYIFILKSQGAHVLGDIGWMVPSLGEGCSHRGDPQELLQIEGKTCSWIRMPSEMSVATCSIFITGNNLTKGEFRLITFSPEK